MKQQRDIGWSVDPGEARGVLIFGIAQLLDVGTTVMGLRSGLLHEGNPIAAGLISHGGDMLLALKLLVGMAVLLTVHRFISPKRRTGALLVMCVIAVAAPALNIAQIVAGG